MFHIMKRAADEKPDNTMDGWARLYDSPTQISTDWGQHRIYSPVAYDIVRTLSLVPVVHTEVMSLAQLFPTCWVAGGHVPSLCVLRSLLADGSSFPGGVKSAMSILPAVFQAYPIVVPYRPDAEHKQIVVDQIVADRPTDIGAPLMMHDGRLSRATAIRAKIALQTGRSLQVTRQLSEYLAQADLLEPWPLSFDLGGGEHVDIQNLLVLSQSRLNDPKIFSAIRKFGIDAGLFLSAHRLSLFRISGLVIAAKTTVATQAA